MTGRQGSLLLLVALVGCSVESNPVLKDDALKIDHIYLVLSSSAGLPGGTLYDSEGTRSRLVGDGYLDPAPEGETKEASDRRRQRAHSRLPVIGADTLQVTAGALPDSAVDRLRQEGFSLMWRLRVWRFGKGRVIANVNLYSTGGDDWEEVKAKREDTEGGVFTVTLDSDVDKYPGYRVEVLLVDRNGKGDEFPMPGVFESGPARGVPIRRK